MKRKLNNTDLVFGISLILGLVFICMFIFVVPYSQDEPFYLNIPVRLINGDSLVKNEWHLTQFSSLFSYLPTLIWIKVKGSTEGLLLFMRLVYLSLLIVLTIAVYIFFRKYKSWAIVAALLFLTQFINIMWQISYHSMFTFSLLLLAFSIFSIYTNQNTYSYIFAGFCFGSCCVCNPFFCFLFGIYLIVCVMWKYKESLFEYGFNLKMKLFAPVQSATKKKNKCKNEKEKNKKFKIKQYCLSTLESYNCFFSKKSIAYVSIGILIIATIAISFFFLTGGSISNLINNIDNLFAFSEYKRTGSVFTVLLSKLEQVIMDFNSMSSNKAFLIVSIFIVLFADKKRTVNSHRTAYIIFSIIYMVIHSVFLLRIVAFDSYFFEFPFFVFSIICYILTVNKNKILFNCMWIPCTIATIVHLLSSNSLLSAANVTLITCNTVGVFFVADLFKEFFPRDQKKKKTNNFINISRLILCVSVCLQLIIHMSFFQISKYTPDSNKKVYFGPYAGINMTEEQFNDYTKTIYDLDYIKNISYKSDPIYITAFQNWMYLYLDRPIGVSTTYYLGYINPDMLHAYYAENKNHIPKYIYIPLTDYSNNIKYDNPVETHLDVLNEIFYFNKTNLSNGILLTVMSYKSPS